MKKLYSIDGRTALLLLLVCAMLPLVFAGRQRTVLQPQVHRLHDWSSRYALYPRFGNLSALEAARTDPRAQMRWREVDRNQENSYSFFRRRLFFRPPIPQQRAVGRDWSISLGTGTVAPGQFPAKFTFDVTAAPSCSTDFVVFPVNVNGSATQPNLVAFNNLYSGTAGGTGICNRAVVAGDVGTSATVLWSYNVHALAAGAVPTSPVISNDATGSKIAFVESAAGSAAHFHVLAWKSGDGKVANVQSVLTPKAITAFSATSPAAASGAATDLALGTASDTISSPFIDYVRDLAYVGNDQGTLYRIKNVFCTLPSCANAAPSLDTTWGTAGAVTVGSGSCSGTAKSTLTGPVLDLTSLNVFVGCADGRVYGFTSTGAALATPFIAVGNGAATGGVVESPVVDGVSGFVYAVSGTGAAPNTASAVLVQAKTDLSSLRVATVGPAGKFNLHAPAPNDNYFSSAVSTTWIMYIGAYVSVAGNNTDLQLYGATFDASRNMTTGTPTNVFDFGTIEGEYSPLTEFKAGATDRLFFGLLLPSATALNFGAFPINTFPTTVPPGLGQGSGPSGITVDNSSASAQASSVYFGVQASHTAVKLTQSGLQ